MSTVQHPQEPEERALPPGSDPTRDVVQPPRATTARPSYRPLAGRAAAATAALGILLVLDLAAVVAGIFEIQLLDKMAAGENVTDAQIDANDTRVGMIAVGQTVVSIACVVCFISWLHRAYENMRALSPPHPRFGSGWAIGGWFVPFLNLVRPKQIINDVYNSGRPSDPPPAWLGLWWAAFIISGFLSRFAFRGTRDDSSLEALTDTSYRYLVADGFDVVAAVLAIIVVRTLSRNQEQRAETAPSAPDEGAAPLPWARPAQPPEASQAPERERPAGPAPLG